MHRHHNDIVEVSNDISFYALVSLSVIFLLLVGYGWATMLTPLIAIPEGIIENHLEHSEILTSSATALRYAAGGAIAVAGIILGKAVAAERIRISGETTPKFKHTWKSYFVVLLMISALGTMNTMFMQSQQSVVLGAAISKTRNHLQQLKSKIEVSLKTPEYDRTREAIEVKFLAFKNELENPGNCGFGAQSLGRFRELQILLPELKPLAIGSSACQNISNITRLYRTIVDKLTDDLPDQATKKRFQQRKAFFTQIEKTITDIEDLKVQNASLNKTKTIPSLTLAWNTYSQILQETELISGTSLGLPAEIADKNVQGMGNITQIIPLLISQFDNPLTYVIIGAAVLFDVLLVTYFTRYLHGQVVNQNSGGFGSSQRAFGMNSSKAKNLIEKTEGSSRGASS